MVHLDLFRIQWSAGCSQADATEKVQVGQLPGGTMSQSPDFFSSLFIRSARTNSTLGRAFVKIVGKLVTNKAVRAMAKERTGEEDLAWNSGGEDECLYNAGLLSAFPGAKSDRHGSGNQHSS